MEPAPSNEEQVDAFFTRPQRAWKIRVASAVCIAAGVAFTLVLHLGARKGAVELWWCIPALAMPLVGAVIAILPGVGAKMDTKARLRDRVWFPGLVGGPVVCVLDFAWILFALVWNFGGM